MSKILPVFDTADSIEFKAVFPPYLGDFVAFERDYRGAHSFLYTYKDNKATFNAYRREVERLLHWSWQKAQKSIFDLRRAETESYIKFCQKPPKSWIGLSKPARFIVKKPDILEIIFWQVKFSWVSVDDNLTSKIHFRKWDTKRSI